MAVTDLHLHPVVGLDLAGRRALVTGGASGIGRACAQRLASAGARITVADRDGAGAGVVAEEIGGRAWAVDLADTAGLADVAVDADVLVNCAGYQRMAPVEEFDPATFAAMVRVMVEAPFLLIRAALPGMYRRRFGRIVNISSVHGHRASAYKVAYVTAKHGLEGLSKVVAVEAAGHGVTCNTIGPSYVRTPLVERQVADQARLHGLAESEVLERVFLEGPAAKRLAEPAEVAELVAYLCSPAGAFITGASLPLDGGWGAR